MFGTLVISSDLEQDTLEYIENPDPVAAVSRNIRDKIHISCLFCRSRKVRLYTLLLLLVHSTVKSSLWLK